MWPGLVRLVGTAGLALCVAATVGAQDLRQTIEDIRFAEQTGLPEADLKRLVLSHYGGLPPAARVTDVAETVKRLLRGEGFRQADATAEIVRERAPERTVLLVRVAAGLRTMIARLDVTGTSTLTNATIVRRTGASVGGPFREREISARLADIRTELRRKGHYKAVAIPRPEFPAGAEPTVNLTLQVDAGPRVRIIYSPSKSHLPSGDVEDFIPITQEYSVEDDLLDDAVVAIEQGLKREGYWKATATHRQSTPRAGELEVTFAIERGKRYRIDRVELPAGLQVSRALIDAEPGLKPESWFSEEQVSAGLRRIVARHYWQNGFYEATSLPDVKEVDAAPGGSSTEGRVVIYPGITEGTKATVRDITFDLAPSPRITAAELAKVMKSKAGGPFVATTALADKEALLVHYANLGFVTATAGIEASFNGDRTQVSLAVTAHEGPRILVGSIEVVGNQQIEKDVILREIRMQQGEPYSEAARYESQLRIYQLGSFRNVQVTPEPRGPGETVQAITITVVEAPTTGVGGGGGLDVARRPRTVEGGGEEDQVEVSPRAFAELTRRNLGGKNRSLSLFSRISLRPTSAPGDPERDGKGFGFSEYKLSGTYRERYAFQSNTDLLVGVTSEQGVRTTFNFIRQAMNVDILHQVRRDLGLSAGYALEFNDLFDERIEPEDQPDIDRLFPQVRLSILSGGFGFDRRNDPLATTTGWSLAATTDLAARPIGSEVGYTKTFVQGLYFRPLTADSRVVAALRAQLGIARGFEREVPLLDENGQPVIGSDGQPVVEVVADLPASQRFFAGGAGTVRGFDIDRLGVPEILDANGLSNGGNGLVILNVELRAVVGNVLSRPFAVVGFVDGGNVFQRAADIDFSRLRGTAGLGARWDSPIGPLRLDVGRKFSQSVFASGQRESKWGWHFSLGQTF